jgi:ABC-type Zn uptake system ZnuABC Zn-binding protein ZnuA
MCKRPRWRCLITFILLGMLFLFPLDGCDSAATTPQRTADAEIGRGMPELSPAALGMGEKLQVVATTNILGDVVVQIAGDQIELTVLMPVGTDPHAFEPTPQDVAAVFDAHIVFANGAGLEEFLEPLLESANAADKVIPVSQGIELRDFGTDSANSHQVEDDHRGADPHTWTDPNNVVVWTHNIEHALSMLDPDGVETYRANAEAYEAALHDLGLWIEEQVAQLAEPDRRLVTDHATFGYFADRYGFEMVGAVIPGYSTLSEPSAQELAELQDVIRKLGVRAVFVGNTVNPSLAERIAEDTGVRIVFLYTGSLSERGGPASSYIEFMQYNVAQIVQALK